MSEIRILTVSDLHGSNACFKKTIALANELAVDAICMTGDLTGKDCIIFSTGHDDALFYEYYDLYDSPQIVPREEIMSLRRAMGDRGVYTWVNRENRTTNNKVFDNIISECKLRRLKQWFEYSDEKLSSSPSKTLFIIPGNDDTEEVEASVEGHNVVNLDRMVAKYKGLQFLGLGVSNQTPYKTHREMTETDIEKALTLFGAALESSSPIIGLIHVPPSDSGLDDAPDIVVHQNGLPELIPGSTVSVGSTAVRNWILSHEPPPLLVLTGHCHDSPGFIHIGNTLCVNPGSHYQRGILAAALIVIEKYTIKGYQSFLR